MDGKIKVLTIVGTRPEIIRLSCVIKALDYNCEQFLLHTGQNYDYELNKVFFDELNLREPDKILNVKSKSLHGQIANIINLTGEEIERIKPDAILILGDTNSALSAINAKRLKIPIYHMEAGDRSFDEDVPEETNRRIVDHISDILLPYTEFSRNNLLREGIHPSKIFVTGSPIAEVYENMKEKFKDEKILHHLDLTKKKFITASIHREENVDNEANLKNMVDSYNALIERYNYKVVVSTHPRTIKSLKRYELLNLANKKIIWHKPLGLIDYICLQKNSFCVVSDSGTIHEDSSILNFPAIAIRKSTEKAESIDAGHCVITGLEKNSVLRTVDFVTKDFLSQSNSDLPVNYKSLNVSSKIVRIILGMNDIIKNT